MSDRPASRQALGDRSVATQQAPGHRIPFCDLGTAKYRAELEQAAARVFAHGQFILGPEVAALEAALSRYCGAPHCISCASGTDALQLALMALDIGPGDEVIVPAFTFAATAEAVALVGATPVFVDIDAQTYTLNAQTVAPALTPRCRAIIAVSLFGQPADHQELDALAREHNLVLIEDAAQSFGARYRDRASCHLSPVACTSFFPAKPLGAFGDGGALFCQDGALAARLRQLRSHGQSAKYQHERVGLNSRLDTLQAAYLLVKVAHLEQELESRRAAAARYGALLSESGLALPQVAAHRRSAWAQYCVRSSQRERLIERLSAAGIPTAIYYPVPLHQQQAFLRPALSLPNAERTAREIFALPFGAHMTDEHQRLVAATILTALAT